MLKKIKLLIYNTLFANKMEDIAGILTDNKTESYQNYEKSLIFKKKKFEHDFQSLISSIQYKINCAVEDGNLEAKYDFKSNTSYETLLNESNFQKQLKQFYRNKGYKISIYKHRIYLSWDKKTFIERIVSLWN